MTNISLLKIKLIRVESSVLSFFLHFIRIYVTCVTAKKKSKPSNFATATFTKEKNEAREKYVLYVMNVEKGKSMPSNFVKILMSEK